MTTVPLLGGRKMRTTTAVDPRDAELMELRARLAEAEGRLSIADELLGREAERADAAEARATDMQVHFFAGLADAAALLFPMLTPGMYADDPMPEDGEPWAPVDGDTADLPPLTQDVAS